VSGRGAGLCALCWASLSPLAGTHCPRCGGSADDDDDQGCLECLRDPPPQQATVVWGCYDGALRSALLAFKHHGHDELAAPLGRRLGALLALQGWAATIDLVTPVPSHRLRRLWRGPTAAASLAAVVAAALRRPLAVTLVRRGLGRQTGRSRAQRLRLARSTFRCRARVADRRVLLVDDVTTTGATLRRATETLLAAGAATVHCAVLAQTPDARRAT
jgi:predicted amidophosphoribosyltransferase